MGHLALVSFCEVRYPMVDAGWWSDLDPYITYFNIQRFVTLMLLLFLFGKVFSNPWISRPTCLVSIVASLFSILEILYYKSKIWDDNDSYMRMAREMLNYEIAIGVLATTILALELTMLVQDISNRSRDIPNTPLRSAVE